MQITDPAKIETKAVKILSRILDCTCWLVFNRKEIASENYIGILNKLDKIGYFTFGQKEEKELISKVGKSNFEYLLNFI